MWPLETPCAKLLTGASPCSYIQDLLDIIPDKWRSVELISDRLGEHNVRFVESLQLSL